MVASGLSWIRRVGGGGVRRKAEHEASLLNGTEHEDLANLAPTRRTKRQKDLFANKQPQSQTKHDILAYYLKPWITIISRHFKKAAYVDGFAGPGACDSGEACSPVLAAQILSEHGGGIEIHLFAIEKRQEIFRRLIENLDPFRNRLRIEAICDSFRSALPRVIKAIATGVPSFFFIDPYGYKDVRFDDIESILRLGHSEVLVHFPYNGIIRGLGVPAVHDTIDHYYGQANVARTLGKATPEEKKDLVVTKFEEGFRRLGCYTRSFEINMPWADRPYFYMVYMTREPIGYIIMNDLWMKLEKEREELQSGGTISLFGIESLNATQETLMDFLTSLFAGRTVRRKAAIATALMHHRSTETEVEKALAALAVEGRVKVQSAQKRQHGLCTFR